jgi:hypothetical protein
MSVRQSALSRQRSAHQALCRYQLPPRPLRVRPASSRQRLHLRRRLPPHQLCTAHRSVSAKQGRNLATSAILQARQLTAAASQRLSHKWPKPQQRQPASPPDTRRVLRWSHWPAGRFCQQLDRRDHRLWRSGRCNASNASNAEIYNGADLRGYACDWASIYERSHRFTCTLWPANAGDHERCDCRGCRAMLTFRAKRNTTRGCICNLPCRNIGRGWPRCALRPANAADFDTSEPCAKRTCQRQFVRLLQRTSCSSIQPSGPIVT